ncbi:hypothetical protein [Nocardioides sp.]|uniref:hypothetical protein n=1 Tax=Nocardioides sp. TaxID=35761 RepID=UPI0035B151F5
MSEQQPGPSQNPYGQPVPSGQDNSYGQSYGYGQQPYGGAPTRSGDQRPGTVTAAAWIAIVFSGLTAALFAVGGLGLLVARDDFIAELEKVPEFQEANVDADAAVGVLVVVLLGVMVWCLIAAVLAVFVLRRSNVARILLVISSSVAAVLSLIGLAGGGVSIVSLVACLATIVLLFVGGAGAWFNRVPAYPGDPSGHQAGYQAGAYGGYGTTPDPYQQPQQPQQQPGSTDYPNPYGNPYGAPSQDQPGGSPNPYGQVPPTHQDPDHPTGQDGQDGQEHPPRDYPGR